MSEVIDFNGIKVSCRPNSTDKDIAMGLIGTTGIVSDEYHLRILAEAGGIFVDVGAYGGHASLLAASLGMRCIAIEPLPDNLVNLRENIRLNGMDDKIEVIPAAIGCGRIYWNDHATDFSIRHRFIAQVKPSPSATPLEVSVVDLDVLLEDYECIHLMKLDCEGGEWALAHSPHTQAKICHIVGEFHRLDERTFDDFRACFKKHDDMSAEFGDGNSVDGGEHRLSVFRLETI